jgi:superfamily II DNA or RNA helicase
MKTAMQELIERLSKTEKQLEKENNLVMSSALYAAKNMALEALEKEKEQIINFCWECLRGDNIHTITSNKELIEYINDKYNQTYNN